MLEYDLSNLYTYSVDVCGEMISRGYKPDFGCFDKYFSYSESDDFVRHKELFKNWHNDRYLKQCYYNLQEKYDCGGISDNEWKLIDELVKSKNIL